MDEPIRILHVVSSMNLGGIQVLLMNIFRNIDRNKVQFDFVFHTSEKCVFTDEITELGGRVYSVPRFSFKNVFSYINAWKAFFEKHKEYRIIHGHIRSTASIYLRIAKKFGCYTIIHSHSTYTEPGYLGKIKTIMEYPLRYIADDYFACSEEAAKLLFGKTTAKHTKIIRNAIETDRFRFNELSRIDTRNELEVNNSIVLGTIGRIEPPKNPFFILEILNECLKLDSTYKMVWVGSGSLLEEVKNKAIEMGIDGSIIFVGPTQKTVPYLNAMDVFLLPSLDEGFGIAAIEAQCAGLFTVVSERVPSSACITPLCKTLKLADGAKVWAKFISERITYERKPDMVTLIKNAGYDIQTTTRFLEEYYSRVSGYFK